MCVFTLFLISQPLDSISLLPFALTPFPRSLLFLLSSLMDYFSWFYDLSGAFPILGFLSLDILILAPVMLFHLVSLLPLRVLLVSPCSGSPICLSLILMSLKILPWHSSPHIILYTLHDPPYLFPLLPFILVTYTFSAVHLLKSRSTYLTAIRHFHFHFPKVFLVQCYYPALKSFPPVFPTSMTDTLINHMTKPEFYGLFLMHSLFFPQMQLTTLILPSELYSVSSAYFHFTTLTEFSLTSLHKPHTNIFLNLDLLPSYSPQ